jgi:hypothetical protein
MFLRGSVPRVANLAPAMSLASWLGLFTRFEDFLTLGRTKLEAVRSPDITAISDANNFDLVIWAKFTAQRSLR